MIHHGDCLEILPTLPAESIDSIVTDPPYALTGASRNGSQRNPGTGPFGRHTLGTKPKGGFMGKEWDSRIPGVAFWAEALRVAKPGAHLLAFGGTRTFHRLTCAIEDAGWEIRDCIMWVYGSGFPKSHNLSGDWQGWGTALKPAWEPIIVARKPLVGTVAQNVQEYGTGAVNVDGCRVDGIPPSVPNPVFNSPTGRTYGMKTGEGRNGEMSQDSGRWPANLIHDGSDEVTGLMGEAARFFYCAKASKADRDEGCEGLEARNNMRVNAPRLSEDAKHATRLGNHHPTVKPTTLMRYLCRLVTPPGGTVLDPFCGSGSTGKAATLEGFNFIGIEREAEYVEIARARIAHARGDMPLLEFVS